MLANDNNYLSSYQNPKASKRSILSANGHVVNFPGIRV